MARMIQGVSIDVTINYNKLHADPKQGKSLDIVLKKVKVCFSTDSVLCGGKFLSATEFTIIYNSTWRASCVCLSVCLFACG